MRKQRRVLAVAAVVVLVGLGLLAQKRPEPPVPTPTPATSPTPAPPRADVAPRPPALLAQVTPDRPSEPLAVTRLAVDVSITGFLARTRTTLTFRNDTGRVLEGELVFPLPEGASVSGYALDLGGQLVDAVVVEREAARVAFESEVRRGVDPGLVEWVRGNNFRTRVWPIPAHGTRTVRVEYVSDLVTEGQGQHLTALYHLPLRQPRPVAEFELRVEVDHPTAAPEVRAGGLSGFRFAAWQNRWLAETRLKDAPLDQDLLVALPDVPRQGLVVEQGQDEGYYFALDDFPEQPAAARPAATRPRRVGLLWDASLSRARADQRRELALVGRWLAGLGDVEVALTVFRNVPEPQRVVAVRAGEASELLRLLESLPCDGGTDLSLLTPPRDVAYNLLVSDGLGTLRPGLPRPAGVPLYAVSSDPQADHGLLRQVAEASGGTYFNLARVADEAVLGALGRPAYSLLSVAHDPGAVAEILPAGIQPVLAGRVTLAGRLVAPEARLTLRYGLPGGDVAFERAYVLRQTDAGRTGLVPRAWAQRKLAELAVAPDQSRPELVALGRKFGIVTPGTSLLVLETLEQHLRHGIEPAASRAELRARYRQAVSARETQAQAKRGDKLERVVALWQERVRWWQTEFRPQPAASRQKARREGQDRLAAADVAEDLEGVPGGVEGGVPGGVIGGVVGGLPSSGAAAPAPMEARASGVASGEPKKGEADLATSPGATISVKPWDPETPYLTAMKQAGPGRAYAVYLAQREQYFESPAFYLDCADHLLRAGQAELGLRVLTSVVELKLEDARLLRVAAHRLQQVGQLGLAIELFERVRRERGEEPQSLRDLALAHAARGDALRTQKAPRREEAAQDYLLALALLDELVRREWDGRFPEIETVALMDANRLLALFERERLPGAERITLDPRLRQPLDVDVRIVLTWDTDQTDMDLWVTEPGGEKCYYGHNLTAAGGRVSRDFTGGYGPEEYLVRRGQPGEYLVQANFYGSRSQSLTGPTTVQATVITSFGRRDERREALTLRLGTARDVVEVGRVRFAGVAQVTP